MSIKSDKWIRRMAEQGLIEPFEPGQVRTGPDGRRLISYGTSSYGYDVRCAREFKIFTNINSTIVDPKQFDEKSFVDVAADVCIIPPNSFALARTVEYFRIPRNVLTVCLGKCVTGDTRVIDADTGAYLPITQTRFGKSTLAWNGRRLERAKVSDFIPQGRREVFELRTRSGLNIRATANHPFLTRREWVPLGELQAGDRIAVARDIPVFGKTPIADREASLLGRTADRLVPQSIFMAPEASVRLFLQSLFSGNGSVDHANNTVMVEYHSNSRRLIEDVHHLLLRFGIFSMIREAAAQTGAPACNLQITDQDQVLRFIERVGFASGSIQQRLLERQVSSEANSPGETRAAIGMAAHAGGRTLPTLGDTGQCDRSAGPVWDEVEQIESVGVEEVFDITVPKLHNFVANDFIVHNSTYARCFSGDTRVALVDGTSATLEDMARGHASGKLYWGYSLGEGGRIIVTLLDRPRYIGRDVLLELTLDNGEVIRVTPDHMFWRRDGLKAAAAELRAGDSLMPLYRNLRRGHEHVYQPVNGQLCPTHRLADEWKLRHEIYAEEPGTQRHHMDIDHRNNRPHDLMRMAAFEHIRVLGQFHGHPLRNHKIAAIREVSGVHDVYCLTVPEAGNFALEAGVFVDNCGIIVNVTPLEPEWEGHVTLEFSNTTPLPAKIYANEGVAQMLFFESDEVCETSYADRGGKYQKQRGVTLPKA